MGLILESQKWRHFWMEYILKSEGLVEPREIQRIFQSHIANQWQSCWIKSPDSWSNVQFRVVPARGLSLPLQIFFCTLICMAESGRGHSWIPRHQGFGSRGWHLLGKNPPGVFSVLQDRQALFQAKIGQYTNHADPMSLQVLLMLKN